LQRKWIRALVAGLGVFVGGVAAADSHAACLDEGSALPVSRVVQIDTAGGPMFGTVTRQAHEPSFLRPKEVVLTFDDGPMPWVTKSILGTLDTFCTKATFFSVGRMALAYPATVKDILARGHTIGTHTYSHPFNMPRMKPEAAAAEIEYGLAAVTTAAGAPIAPFFRFTGLADSARLLAYLKSREIATFTVDVVSNDSYIHDPEKLVQRTMTEVRRHRGGIILFHDIKTTTAKALPRILASLKAEGFSVVHITAKHPAEPLAAALRDVAPKLSLARNGEPGGKTLLPFYGAIGPDIADPKQSPQVTSSEPALANSSKPAMIAHHARDVKAAAGSVGSMKSSITDVTGPPVIVEASDSTSKGWITTVESRPNAVKAAH
jgi:peptidoglycan-N-acetylglucosamine deacetylase